MTTLLLPCDGSSNALLAVRYAIQEFRRGGVRLVHLLNVQPPFSAHIARHVSREARADLHRERADEELAQARRLLDALAVAYQVHTEVGDKAACIAAAARRLRCDRVVIGTTRQPGLLRAIDDSLTSRLLRRCPVPVQFVEAAPARTRAEPAGAGGAAHWRGVS